MLENKKYGSYPQTSDFNNLPIEYKQRLFTKRPIYILTDNSVESLKVSSIELLLDNRRYKSNNGSAHFDDLPFDGDKRLLR